MANNEAGSSGPTSNAKAISDYRCQPDPGMGLFARPFGPRPLTHQFGGTRPYRIRKSSTRAKCKVMCEDPYVGIAVSKTELVVVRSGESFTLINLCGGRRQRALGRFFLFA